jgi:hypothetical protein
MLWFIATVGSIMADVFRYVYINVCCLGICARRAHRRLREREKQRAAAEERDRQTEKTAGSAVVLDDLMEIDDDNQDTGDLLGVPLTVTLTVVFGYVAMGAVLFGVWEHWTAMDAAYFCFITISTIGFGDFVPGAAAAKGIRSTNDAVKLIVDAVYIVVGMAIISMAFNLIQDNMVNKAKLIMNLKLNGVDVATDDGQGSRLSWSEADGERVNSATGKRPIESAFGRHGQYPSSLERLQKSATVVAPPAEAEKVKSNGEEVEEEETSFNEVDTKKPGKTSPPAKRPTISSEQKTRGESGNDTTCGAPADDRQQQENGTADVHDYNHDERLGTSDSETGSTHKLIAE